MKAEANVESGSSPAAMRRFLGIAAATLVLLFGFAWYWVSFHSMAVFSLEYPYWAAKLEMARQGRCGKVVILGDSCPMVGVIPSRLDAGAVNMAVAGATPIEMYYLATKIWTQSQPQPPRTAVLSISPILFNPTLLFWGQTVGFGLLSHANLEEVRREAHRFDEKSLFGPKTPWDIEARLKDVLTTAKFPSYYYGSLMHDLIGRGGDGNYRAYAEALVSRGQTYLEAAHSPNTPDHDTALTSFTPTPLFDLYFDRTLSFLAGRGVQVYLVIVPRNVVSIRMYNPAMIAGFDAYMNGYAKRYPNFHVLQGLTPWPSEYFNDESHLNPKGAELWSETLRQILNDAHAPGSPFVPEDVTGKK
jgi:hypothetical protein